MIFDHLENAAIYYPLGPGFELGLQYLRAVNPETPVGKLELEGRNVRASIESYTTTPALGRDYEAHRLHADIQYIVSGKELIYHAPIGRLRETQPYDPEKDVTMYEGGDIQPIYLNPGQFTILWPQDAHKPNSSWRGPTDNKKVVIKVRIA
jgi:YhcH/YjgK/YiaL family protein